MKLLVCQNCQKNQAAVSYTYIQNGHQADYILCLQCATNLHMEERFGKFSNQVSFSFKAPSGGGPKTTHHSSTASMTQSRPSTATIPAVEILNSKILALEMDKEAAIAEENYLEAARIKKILDQLHEERKNLK